LLGRRLHEELHAALRRRVVDVAGPRDDLVDRRDADDLAGGARDLRPHALSDHRAGRGAGAEEGSGEVHADHRVPLLERHVGDRRVTLEAGVADEDVDAAPRALHLGEHHLHVRFLRHVRTVVRHWTPPPAERFANPLAASRCRIPRHDRRGEAPLARVSDGSRRPCRAPSSITPTTGDASSAAGTLVILREMLSHAMATPRVVRTAAVVAVLVLALPLLL